MTALPARPPAEQETDECDAPTRGQIYVGLGWTKDILVMRAQDVTADSQAVFAALKSLQEAFARQSMVGVKMACDALVEAATALRGTAGKISDDGGMLSRKAREHLNRKPQI